jgi:hypothetical protein
MSKLSANFNQARRAAAPARAACRTGSAPAGRGPGPLPPSSRSRTAQGSVTCPYCPCLPGNAAAKAGLCSLPGDAAAAEEPHSLPGDASAAATVGPRSLTGDNAAAAGPRSLPGDAAAAAGPRSLTGESEEMRQQLPRDAAAAQLHPLLLERMREPLVRPSSRRWLTARWLPPPDPGAGHRHCRPRQLQPPSPQRHCAWPRRARLGLKSLGFNPAEFRIRGDVSWIHDMRVAFSMDIDKTDL